MCKLINWNQNIFESNVTILRRFMKTEKRLLFSVPSTAICLSREKSSTREENNFDCCNENRQSSPSQKTHQIKNSSRSENKVNSRSSDNESPLSSQTPQGEKDEASSRLEESSGNKGEGNGSSNGSKSISAIFSGHGKLRRLLGTLVHFAMDISPDTGDTVRSLVLGLLVNIFFQYDIK